MQTTPLAKAITTLEGQLVLASDAVLTAGAAIDPQSLPPKYAGIIVAVQHVALLVQRYALKAKASKTVAQIVNSSNPEQAVLAVLEERLDRAGIAK